MSLFNQDIEKAAYQALVDKGSEFYQEVIEPTKDGLSASYDGQSLYIHSEASNCKSILSINAREDLFRNYLPTIKSIKTRNVALKIYQFDLDGGDISIDASSCAFCGKTLKNIKIRSLSRINPGISIETNYMENVKLNAPYIRFHSQMNNSNRAFGIFIPDGGDNIKISNNCVICLEGRQNWDMLTTIYKSLDTRGMLDLLGTQLSWGNLFYAFSSHLALYTAMPLKKGIKLSRFLKLPPWLEGRKHYILSFPGEKSIRIHFIKSPNQDVHLSRTLAQVDLDLNHCTEDGYYICC